MCRAAKPLPAGQKRKRESWETVWYVGMYGTMGLATVLLYYKPDTRCVVPPTIRITLPTSLFSQYPVVGIEGSQGPHGGARRET